MIEVRAARASEIDDAHQLAQSVFAELRDIYVAIEMPEPTVASGGIDRLIAYCQGKLAGTTLFEKSHDRLHLRGLAVSRELRQRGIASAIVSYLKDAAQMQGARALSLYTIEATGNRSIFERMGFVVVRSEPATWARAAQTGGSLTDLYMELNTSVR